MANESRMVLLIEGDPDDVALVERTLSGLEDEFQLVQAQTLAEGLGYLAKGNIDVVLLDLSLPDSRGLDTLARTIARSPDVPVVVMVGMGDDKVGITAVREGAQDFLKKGQMGSDAVAGALRYAIRLQSSLAKPQATSHIDELTGCHTRRDFLTLGGHQTKVAARTKKGFLVIFADFDNLSKINETLSREDGDRALMETADVLKETFRGSDIIARIGGDEFGILALEASVNSTEILTARLLGKLAFHNAQGRRQYTVSVSIGIARYDPETPGAIHELLAGAEKDMLERRQGAK